LSRCRFRNRQPKLCCCRYRNWQQKPCRFRNQHSLPKLCYLQRINICCRNCFVFSEPLFVAKSCCLQRISVRCQIVMSTANQCSQPSGVCNESLYTAESCCPQGISVRWSESVFAAETVLYAANECSLPKLCCPHQISFYYQIMLSTPNQFSLLIPCCL